MRRTGFRRFVYLSLVAIAITVSQQAAAQTGDESSDLIPQDLEFERQQKTGWELKLQFGASPGFVNTKDVIGQADGDTYTINSNIQSLADYYFKRHEWRNRLDLSQTFTRTPQIPQWYKSSDELNLESIYLYYYTTYFGPFARAAMDTAVFEGNDVRSEPTEYVISRANGDVDVVIDKRLPLTDPFSPMIIKQTVGAFYRPLSEETINLELRLGPGARETLADGQFTLDDNEDTPQIEVTELESYNTAGSEVFAGIWGTISKGVVDYRIDAEAFTPFWDDTEQSTATDHPIDYTSVDLTAALSVALIEWASLDYELSAVRQPQLLYYWQLKNTLNLRVGFTLHRQPQVAQPPPSNDAAEGPDNE